eukprot:TRINITY_DN16853_c0_g1_i1.p1 TRINITY_DN16853_c0_g1~~TRINITY_DN16853_c0_g1_i1.p1  ORF type:complete len:579 (+),score=207.99 TRINITY_DN16853_c0_g1_i1:65-1801(+)
MASSVARLLAVAAAAAAVDAGSALPFYASGDWEPFVGRYAFNITTASAEAQRLFKIGLVLLYNFDQPNARVAFSAALDADAACCMCWWGQAHAHGPFLNHPVVPADGLATALGAAKNASACAAARGLSLKEQVLIEAMRIRYPEDGVVAHQNASYTKYSNALRAAREAHAEVREDPDVMTFDAEGRMILKCDDNGYHFYISHGDDQPPTPAFGTEAISALLRQVLNATANHHAYAAHLLIHSTEMSNAEAVTAVATARYLMANMRLPVQSQHLQHMSSHTFFRTGHYHEAIEANEAAVVTDDAFLSHGKVPYGPGHNVVFLVACAMFGGERAVAYKYVQHMQELYAADPGRPDGPNGAVAWGYPMLVALRFGDWADVQRLDVAPPGNFSGAWPYGYGVVREFALAVAAAHGGDMRVAQGSVDALQALLPEIVAAGGEVASAAQIANHTASAVVAHAAGRLEEAAAALQAAVAIEMAMPYDEPPMWLFPTRECYGQALLDAGDAAAAEKIFRGALYGYSSKAEPNCGWALSGLQRSLEAQPSSAARKAELAKVAEAIAEAWVHADVPLAGPCSLLVPLK